MDATHSETRFVPAHIGLWDATSLIVGIIIGVGIFQTPASVFDKVSDPWLALLTWFAGGGLALVGALCFAEMASAYPRSGGEYVYLTRAFGSWLGFVYAWAQLVLIRPASIGAVAYIFAIHAGAFFNTGDALLLFYALASIVVLSAINVVGVTFGRNVQNLLTVLKVLGLVGILVVGLGWGGAANFESVGPVKRGWFAESMILVLWTYAGWHEAAYIASEVKDSRRTLPLALILGTVLVTVLYLLVNLSLVFGLGVAGAKSESAAAALVSLAWPNGGGEAMSVLIMVSALGALNGMIFTTARIAVAFGDDHPFFRPLCRWSPRLHTPARALNLQALLSMILVLGVFLFGPALNRRQAGAPHDNPFDDLINVTAAVFWFLFLLTGIALFVLRRIDPDTPRPFRTPGYPVLPILFCAMCLYMIYGSVMYRPWHSLAGLGITVAGAPLYFVRRHKIKVINEHPEKCSVG